MNSVIIKAMFADAQRDPQLLSDIVNEWHGPKPENSPNLLIGPSVSGAAVVANDHAVNSIREHSRKLVGIDMEAYGLIYASTHCVAPQPMGFSLKAVCDYADQELRAIEVNRVYLQCAACTSTYEHRIETHRQER